MNLIGKSGALTPFDFVFGKKENNEVPVKKPDSSIEARTNNLGTTGIVDQGKYQNKSSYLEVAKKPILKIFSSSFYYDRWIKALEDKNYKTAIQLFGELKGKADLDDCHTLLEMLVEADQQDEFINILKEMEPRNLIPNLKTYEIVNRFLLKKDLEKEQIKGEQENFNSYEARFGYKMNKDNCDLSIHNYAELDQWVEVTQVWRKMKKRGIEPDQITYDGLIRAVINQDFLDKADEFEGIDLALLFFDLGQFELEIDYSEEDDVILQLKHFSLWTACIALKTYLDGDYSGREQILLPFESSEQEDFIKKFLDKHYPHIALIRDASYLKLIFTDAF